MKPENKRLIREAIDHNRKGKRTLSLFTAEFGSNGSLQVLFTKRAEVRSKASNSDVALSGKPYLELHIKWRKYAIRIPFDDLTITDMDLLEASVSVAMEKARGLLSPELSGPSRIEYQQPEDEDVIREPEPIRSRPTKDRGVVVSAHERRDYRPSAKATNSDGEVTEYHPGVRVGLADIPQVALPPDGVDGGKWNLTRDTTR